MLRINRNENILASYRRHWVVLVGEVFAIGFIGMVIILAIILLNKFIPNSLMPPYRLLVVWITLLIYHALFIIFFIKLADYWLDVWIVTNERVIDIEQKGLFKREISEFKLDRIQDVTVDVRGVLQTFFGYGDVQIETAGSERDFVFKTVANAYEIKNKILKVHDEYMQIHDKNTQGI